MEGVVYSLKDCLEIIREMGVDISEVRASGGGGKSMLWKQMQADIFGIDISTIQSSEVPHWEWHYLPGWEQAYTTVYMKLVKLQ
jgi:sugar (pentulose or hexulose) kinase